MALKLERIASPFSYSSFPVGLLFHARSATFAVPEWCYSALLILQKHTIQTNKITWVNWLAFSIPSTWAITVGCHAQRQSVWSHCSWFKCNSMAIHKPLQTVPTMHSRSIDSVGLLRKGAQRNRTALLHLRFCVHFKESSGSTEVEERERER